MVIEGYEMNVDEIIKIPKKIQKRSDRKDGRKYKFNRIPIHKI